MPDWKTHFIFSLFFVIAVVYVLSIVGFHLSVGELAVMVVISVFASLFPDVDTKKSKIRTAFSLIVASASVTAYLVFFFETWYYAPAYFAIIYLLIKYIPAKHRGVTHTAGFSVIFSFLLAITYVMLSSFSVQHFLLFFTVSLASYNLHLLLDKK